MSLGHGPIRLLSCGIFRDEYQLLPEDLKQVVDPLFLDSMLHMDPGKLDSLLSKFLQKHGENPALILFGDCCPHMQELGGAVCYARTNGVNCCEIYLGHERYHTLCKERTFFLMPEWTKRWEQIVKKELGFTEKKLAREFMAQSMSKAVYIDTGVMPVPVDELAAFSDYTGLESSIEPTGPEHFIAAVRDALAKLGNAGVSTKAPEYTTGTRTELGTEGMTAAGADAGEIAHG